MSRYHERCMALKKVDQFMAALWEALDTKVEESDLPNPKLETLKSIGITRVGHLVLSPVSELTTDRGLDLPFELEDEDLRKLQTWLTGLHRKLRLGMDAEDTLFWFEHQAD